MIRHRCFMRLRREILVSPQAIIQLKASIKGVIVYEQGNYQSQ